MLDLFTTITCNDTYLTLFVKIDELNYSIELKYQVTNEEISRLKDKLLCRHKFDFKVVDAKANNYSIYGCKFLRASTSYTPNCMVQVITGVYDRIIKEKTINQKYEAIIFNIKGMENLFPLEKFHTEFETENNSMSFSKERKHSDSYDIYEGIKCVIESRFYNVVSKDDLFQLDVRQEKVIKLVHDCEKDIDQLLDKAKVIKSYFEFLYQHETYFSFIEFGCKTFRERENGKLLVDKILKEKQEPQLFNPKKYVGTKNDFFVGLNAWMQNYEKYKRVIEIWEKTIYNSYVSEEDLFIWRCQAFELLCTINEEILDKAKLLKAAKQASPNLKNFMTAVTEVYSIPSPGDKYFMDAKNVRDKLTHNNPQKTVTENQKKNSYKLIECFFVRTFATILNIQGISTSYCLNPDE